MINDRLINVLRFNPKVQFSDEARLDFIRQLLVWQCYHIKTSWSTQRLLFSSGNWMMLKPVVFKALPFETFLPGFYLIF